MMKRLLLLLLVSSLGILSYAEKYIPPFFEGQKLLKIEFDYTQARINNMPFETYLKYLDGKEKTEDAFYKVVAPVLEASFTKGFFKNQWVEVDYSETPKAKYRAVVVFTRVDDDGESFGDINFYEVGKTEILAALKLHGEDGKWNTTETLWAEGLEGAGKSLGETMKKWSKHKSK